MKNSYYVYNNEAIACCIFLEILREVEKMDYARFFLILPFLMDDRNVYFLNKGGEIDVEDFFKNNNRFNNFNSRFLSLIPIAINSLIMLTEIGLIGLDKQKNIFLIDNDFFNFSLSERLIRIESAIPILLDIILNISTESLYVNLGVEL
ncbi:three component ABC system middle component [Acinetobacter sp.]|uniref:three component ABC system middle component n=1 Tax=Acinetobacter sp. TaxID=472 RepID=UPI002FDACAA6